MPPIIKITQRNLALLSKSYDFIESVEAVRSLSSIDDDGINNPDASVGVLNPPHE